jgi:hypothetical protein
MFTLTFKGRYDDVHPFRGSRSQYRHHCDGRGLLERLAKKSHRKTSQKATATFQPAIVSAQSGIYPDNGYPGFELKSIRPHFRSLGFRYDFSEMVYFFQKRLVDFGDQNWRESSLRPSQRGEID